MALFSDRTGGLTMLFQWARKPLKLPLSLHGSGTPSNTWICRPTQVIHPNGISIGSAFLAGLMNVTNRHTDHATPSIAIGVLLTH